MLSAVLFGNMWHQSTLYDVDHVLFQRKTLRRVLTMMIIQFLFALKKFVEVAQDFKKIIYDLCIKVAN